MKPYGIRVSGSKRRDAAGEKISLSRFLETVMIETRCGESHSKRNLVS
jgi:hypothetical protein